MSKIPVAEQPFTNLHNQDGPIYEEIPVLDSNYYSTILSKRPLYDLPKHVLERKDSKLTKNRRFFWILGGVVLGVVILIVAIVLIVLGASKFFI